MPSLCPWLRPAEERQTGRRMRRAAASVGFTVAMETVSSLLNTCFWWHHTPGLSTQSEGFFSVPNLNPETGHWCVWWRGGGVLSEIIMTKNYWGRNAGTLFSFAANPRRPSGSLTAQPHTAWVIFVFVCCDCGLLVGFACFSHLWWKALWPKGGGVEPFGFNLKKKKKEDEEKKKTQRADRVQWPSFLQAGMPVSGCHTGHSTASDFRAERAVCWVGGQMEGILCLLSSAGIQPLPSSLPVPCPFIYSFSQVFFFALTLSQRCPPFRSWMLLVYACPPFFFLHWKLKVKTKGAEFPNSSRFRIVIKKYFMRILSLNYN